KVFTPKKEEKKVEENGQKVDIGEEWETALEDATEEDLVQLAGILGIHSMLNQDQLNAAIAEETLDPDRMTFKGPAKFSALKIQPAEPPNDTDVDKSLEQLQKNDASLKELNLNNIKSVPIPTVKNILEALEKNTQLTSLSMASTRIGDETAPYFAQMLKENKTLKSLNVESNFLTGEGIKKIMTAMKENTTLLELRMANQRMMMGIQVETEVADILVNDNKTLVKFGLAFQHAGPRRKAHDAVLRNYEIIRKQRTKKE
ncbi:putative tropomodulin-1-like, partial [Apostichopus japonicus]